ncbi:uncharacterized protein LOC142229745 [Haematobia irritans]|uniref:uncharacterized protein LOC142229745 n=1 Tax=Haematobia irritans TaxID=7368 RepID=UPI003F4F60F8
MCDIDCANLIDLSLDEPSPKKTETSLPELPSENQALINFSPPFAKRDSLDNNPFDCVQKLANCQDDPFEIVERQACLKARMCTKPPSIEVKVGNLLSLSNENLLDAANYGEDEKLKSKVKDFDLDAESPPVMLLDKFPGDSNSGTDTDSTPNNSAEVTSSAKIKKAMEYRKRLLKLSVTNAAFNSPSSRRASLEEMDSMGTPKSSSMSKASMYCEFSLAAESPLKFVDDDIDIMAEEPPALVEAEKNFEADLEMLKIPMLSELPSPVVHNTSPIVDCSRNPQDIENESLTTKFKKIDLEAIRSKLKTKRDEKASNNNHDIQSLICDLKSLIEKGDIAEGKQKHASELLETLSSALSTSKSDICPNSLSIDNCAQPRQPMKRQGTFDLDLPCSEGVLDSQPLVSEMPNCMVSSSATYDGETAEDKDVLELPEIDPLSPHSSNGELTLQPDVNDIVEQLSKLLMHNNSSDNSQNSQQNPTFIVVMNTTPMPQHNNSISVIAPSVKQNAAMVASYMENSEVDDTTALEANTKNSAMRRRSQSLSLHDKIKIVQLPLQSPTPKTLTRQNSTTALDDSDCVSTPPTQTTEVDDHEFKTPEFRTPARMVRRNSYSSGTPYTTTVGLRRSSISLDNKSSGHARLAQTLDTHHESGQQPQQQRAIVRPMPMPNFKPDLKKRHKTNNESVMKSSGPLKATLPMKKVAPMIKSSPPTPDSGSFDDLHNTSVKQKSKRMPTTPMVSGRTSTLGVGSGYPNACSTPSILVSPVKRSSVAGALPKPRYSYLSTTPNAKPVSSASTANLKRRTIAEFKAKSPLKTKASTNAASTSMRTGLSTRSSVSSRLSTSSMAKLPPSKTSTKLTPNTNTATVKPNGRSGSRFSSAASVTTSRNKENKHP